MRLIDELKAWFERDVHMMTWREVEAIVDQPRVAEIRFSTERFRYVVTADVNHGESFLGGTCFDRVGRQSRDLSEGDCSERTWDKIVVEILENERGPVRSTQGRHEPDRPAPLIPVRAASTRLEPSGPPSDRSESNRQPVEKPPRGRLF